MCGWGREDLRERWERRGRIAPFGRDPRGRALPKSKVSTAVRFFFFYPYLG